MATVILFSPVSHSDQQRGSSMVQTQEKLKEDALLEMTAAALAVAIEASVGKKLKS